MAEGNCLICHVASPVCGKCKLVSYCTQHKSAHIREDYCFPFTIQQNSDVGRHYIAVCDIQPMELIVTEQAVSTGPYTKTIPQCLGCCRTGSLSYLCPGCRFPLCQEECAEGQHMVECKVFSKAGFKAKIENLTRESPSYAAIAVIRLFNLRDSNPSAFDQLMKFEHHKERRRLEDLQLTQYHTKYVVDFLIKVCKLKVSASEVYQVLGAMFTNSLDIELPKGYGRENGFYPTYAYINHSCRSNAVTVRFPDKHIEVRAQTLIRKGEEISTQYLDSIKPTFIRRPMLEKKWMFECNCARCTDPTEGGTYLSALLCRKGKCGGSVLPLDPTDGSSEWRCRKCNTEIDTSLVIKIVTSISSQIDNPSPGVQPIYFYEKLISLYSNILHPSHYLNYQMKERLSILYGNIPGFLLKSMTRPQLDRKIQVCLEVLDVQNKLYPGHSSIKIKILGELNKTRLCTVKTDVDQGILLRVCYEKVLRSEEDLKKYLQLYKTKFFKK